MEIHNCLVEVGIMLPVFRNIHPELSLITWTLIGFPRRTPKRLVVSGKYVHFRPDKWIRRALIAVAKERQLHVDEIFCYVDRSSKYGLFQFG